MHLPRRFRLGLGIGGLAGVGRAGGKDAAPEDGGRIAAVLRFGAERLAGPDGLAHLDAASDHPDVARRIGRTFDRFPALRSCFQVATGWGLRFDPTEERVEDVSLVNLCRSVESSARHLRGIDRLYLRTHPGVDLDRLRWLLRGGDGCIERMRDLRKRRLHGVSQIGISLSSREALEMIIRSPDLLAGFDALQLGACLATEDPDLAARLQSLDLPLVLITPSPGEAGAPDRIPDGASGLDRQALDVLPDALLLIGASDLAQLARRLERLRRLAALGPLEIGYACEPVPAAEARETEDALARHLLSCELDTPASAGDRQEDPAATAEAIARALIGTRQTRLGPAPTGASYASLLQRVADHASQGLPVDVILTWGPRKFHASREDNRADVAELTALARLCDFQRRVRRIHPPGLRYTLFYEDLEGAFIEGEDDRAFWPYGSGLVRLVNVLGVAGGLRVVATRGLLRRFDPDELDARLTENYRHLCAHWRGSGDAQALARLGFSGEIDPKTRGFYLERLDRLLADRRSREDKQDMVIRLFASVLLHRQLQMFRIRPDLEPVKLSFLPLAGGPASLADGRVDVRSISADLCKHSLAPWSAKGYLRRRNGEIQPASRPWPAPLPAGARLLRGELRLRRGEASVELRADRLAAGP